MDENLRSLHLHTLESLCADLISGRPVGVGNANEPFTLGMAEARSVFQWYFHNRTKWSGNVTVGDVNSIVDSVGVAPVNLPSVVGTATHSVKRYILLKVQAHRFAGIHHPGTATKVPADFVYEFKSPMTMFEGLNGSGKTSILNTIIWALTGEILRPQRLPEIATAEFECEIEPENEQAAATIHKLTPVTPLPDPTVERPSSPSIPADTWVELTFQDDAGVVMPPIRRAQTRTARGKLEESVTGLDTFGLDPVAVRTGTVMPGMLPFIQVGSESKLGKAVAELTGMAPLIKLASHAERAKKKVDGDFTKERKADIDTADLTYRRSLTDLIEQIKLHPAIAYPHTIPQPSADSAIEAILTKTVSHFEQLKAAALADAKQVLGEGFDASDADARADLEGNIAPATAAVRGLGNLPSAARLAGLAKLTDEELGNARARIDNIFEDAKVLGDLAADPSKAGRIRLYSRVAAWAKEHPDASANQDICLVCGRELGETVDPVTGQTVKQHLHEAAGADAALLSQTLSNWATLVLGELARDLQAALQLELRRDLPAHPGALIRQALVEELFDTEPFQGVLNALRDGLAASCDAAIAKFAPLDAPVLPDVAQALPELKNLQFAIVRLDTAIWFSRWRRANKASVSEFMTAVVGLTPADDRPTVLGSLMGQLQRLQAIVEGVEPINQALTLCARMVEDLAKRRKAEHRMEAYRKTSSALQECMKVGGLAEKQVQQLQDRLQKSAVTWRSRIYQGAFPSTNHDLVATRMSGEGQLEFFIGADGISAPAQHVANASALRASLVGFFLAYWEYLLRERGGLQMLLLDDPEELLDGDNRERLANATVALAQADAQLVLTTHEIKFASLVARSAQASQITIDYQYVHPATRMRGTIYTSPSVAKVQKYYVAHLANPDDPEAAQDYASECRIFIEGRLGDLFDDGAFPAASAHTFAPTLMDHLGRLRGLVKSSSNELFRSPVLGKLCKDQALLDNAPALTLLNKAHHSSKRTILPTEVVASREDLERLRREVERVHEEFRLFRRREKLQRPTIELPVLDPSVIPAFSVEIQPNLAAFMRGAAVGESQEVELEKISSAWFEDKAFYLLRSGNFGFAAPAPSIAIVEAIPSKVEDRQLVIARRGQEVFARRLLRPGNAEFIALAAETPDPRRSPPTLLFDESEVALHRVVGILFGDVVNPPKSKHDAVWIDGSGLLPKVFTAYRIKEESAIPLALPGQIALGGRPIMPSNFDSHLDAYVALHLSDGSSIFKRVGEKLPAPLSHLRRFESIGGLGVADVLAIDGPQSGIRTIEHAVLIVGVLYYG